MKAGGFRATPFLLNILNVVLKCMKYEKSSAMCLYLEVSEIHANVTDGLLLRNVLRPEPGHLFLPLAVSVQSRY